MPSVISILTEANKCDTWPSGFSFGCIVKVNKEHLVHGQPSQKFTDMQLPDTMANY